MKAPELAALIAGDEEAWEEAFAALWPVALATAHARLEATCPTEIEEVAIEALETLVEKVKAGGARHADDLPRLAKTIADRQAISKWRELTAQKRGAGKTDSLNAPLYDGEPPPEPPAPTPGLTTLDLAELHRLLDALQEDLNPDHKTALHDFFLDGLSYEEISRKRGWPVGTVGVYIQRGLAAIRAQREKNPGLLKEAAAFLRLLLW